MNQELLDSALLQALGADETVYPVAQRLFAVTRAIQEYSFHRPVMRRFGTGSLWQAAAVGDTRLLVVGGTWVDNDTAVVGQYGPHPETVSISAAGDAVDTWGQTTRITELTLAAPLTRARRAGTAIGKSEAGLALVSGQEGYLLPRDWVRVDQETFDLAVGARAQVRRTAAYYDAVYTFSSALSGVGFGGAANFGPALPPLWSAPATGIEVVANVGQQAFRFLVQDPPLLMVSPAPTADHTLDFYYYGMHTPESVPEADAQAVLSYARYVLLSTRAADIAGNIDYTEADVTENASRNSGAYQKLAADALEDWERRIVRVPVAVLG